MDDNFDFPLPFEMTSNEASRQQQIEEFEQELRKKSLSEEVESALATAREVLLNNMEMGGLSPIRKEADSLSPLDEILNDIYDFKSAEQETQNHTLANFEVCQPAASETVSFFDNADNSTTNSSGFVESNYMNDSPNFSNLYGLHSTLPPITIFPPIHQQTFPVEPPFFNYHADDRMMSYTSAPMTSNFQLPGLYGQQFQQPLFSNSFAPSEPPAVDLHANEGSAFQMTPKFFTPKIVVGESHPVVSVVETPQSVDGDDSTVVFTKINRVLHSPEYLLVKPPENVKRPQTAEEKILELEVSSYFDTSNVEIPMLKERPRAVTGTNNRRKQKHKPIQMNDDLIFETPKKPQNDNNYSESELVAEVFKRKKRVFANRKPTEKKQKGLGEQNNPTSDSSSMRDSYVKNDRVSAVMRKRIEPSSDSDSEADDIPLTAIKSMKCPKCKKIFKTSNSLSTHRKRCTVIPTPEEEQEEVSSHKETDEKKEIAETIDNKEENKPQIITSTPFKVKEIKPKRGRRPGSSVTAGARTRTPAPAVGVSRPKTRSQTKPKPDLSTKSSSIARVAT